MPAASGATPPAPEQAVAAEPPKAEPPEAESPKERPMKEAKANPHKQGKPVGVKKN
ncbi:MAG: hypothetical protein FJ090_19915 [Deltaproteobacteria bacterium]|nr:hypothetical protein [Deltaproteobacteria bacterium]